MSNIILNGGYKHRTKTEIVLTFAICVVSTTLTGWLFAALSGAVRGLPASTPAASNALSMIVWTALYILMGTSLFLTITADVPNKLYRGVRVWSLLLWGVQLILSLALPFLIFSARAYMPSFVMITILDTVVAALIVINFKLRPAAAFALLPYIAWIAFMTYTVLYMAINL